jgi:glycosyltransferase involved in cell wall biosynthesis
MANSRENHDFSRRRLLITAYHYDCAYSMESRLSWQRAQHAAQTYDVTVISARPELYPAAATTTQQPVNVVLLPLNRLERTLMSLPGAYYFGYRLWHRRVFRLAQTLHAKRPFSLVHHVSFCGYREPSDGWKLGVPFIWGPVGGTQLFPIRFLGQLDPLGAVRELARNAGNYCQLHFDRRIRRASRAAAQVLAANTEVANDLSAAINTQSAVLLETGVHVGPQTPRSRRDPAAPLRILWSGRLQPWKGLPLLLRALATLPAECRYHLRVLGWGPSLRRWQLLAKGLGIAAHVEWVGWPEYARQLPHYEWADVFAFTSLRDTSGSGLLEALNAGAPIIGLNHQGAADIMTKRCAVAVDVTTPAEVVVGFRDAIARLAGNEVELHTLSHGAIERARDFSWDRQWQAMHAIYQRAEKWAAAPLRETSSVTLKAPASTAPCLVEA